MTDPSRLLVSNALVQIAFSAWFGGWLLHRLHIAGRRSGARDLIAAHVDWIMLALVQVAVAYGIERLAIAVPWPPAVLIAAAGWLNPVPYVARGLGVNAFVLGGPWPQRCLALVGATSAIGLTTGLTWVVAIHFLAGTSP